MVSVIIPVYNVEKYLDECLQSVIAQDYSDLQIICVNDGSTDSSQAILKEYERKYTNIEVYIKKNGGLSSARNYGIEKAKGEYVFFLDSDDKLADNSCISFMAKKMDENKLDVLCFDGESFFESEDLKNKNYSYSNYYDRTKSYGLFESGYDLFIELFKDGNYRENIAVKCIRRNLIIDNNLRFMDGMIYEDAFFSFCLVLSSKRVEHVKRSVYKRRVREGSITQKPIFFYNVYSMFCGYVGILEILKKYGLEQDEWVSKYIGSLKEYLLELYYQISKEERKKINNLNEWERYILESIIPQSSISEYVFPYHLFPKNSRILLYGAGKIGKIFFNIGKIDGYVDIVGIADKRANELCRNSFPVISVEDISSQDFDYLLICVENIKIAEEIENQLVKIGLNRSRIKWDGINYKWENRVKREKFINYLISKKTSNKKSIYLMMLPEHGNLGDYLIGYSSQDFILNNFGEYELVNVTTDEWHIAGRELKSLITPDDILVFSGGGYIGDVWDSGAVLKEIIETFPCNKKIIMPNTLTYKEMSMEHIHNDLKKILVDKNTYLCFRDKKSYDICSELGMDNYCIYVPDMALYSHIKKRPEEQLDQVLLCMRDDEEKIFDNIEELKNGLDGHNIIYDEFNISRGKRILQDEGQNELNKAFATISKYKLVITDRLHVMLICYLTQTPCVAFDNSTNKVSEVYKWINGSGIICMNAFNMEKILEMYKANIRIKVLDLENEFESLSSFMHKIIENNIVKNI